MYRLQNAAVALSAFSAFVTSYLGLGSFLYWACVLALILAAAISSVGCQGSSLSVEREWTKALCQGDSASLAGLNAGGLVSKMRETLPRLYTLRLHNASSLHIEFTDISLTEPLRFLLPTQYGKRTCASWVTKRGL